MPPGYDDAAEARYPVLYMHDGQNLFDPRLTGSGEIWDAFGACGCISSHFSLSEATVARFTSGDESGGGADDSPYILRDIENGLAVPDGVRYWFDYGTEGLDAEYHEPHQAIRQWLLQQDLSEGADFVIKPYEGANHNEASWRERLDEPLTFLFASRVADGDG